jgi:hypothetical protein
MIEFDPVGHTYTNTETGEQYISVTALIGKYEPEFDAPGIAARISKRDGIPVDMILETWETIKDNACKRGSMIHDMLENYIKHGDRAGGKLPWLFDEFDRLIKQEIWRVGKMHSEIVLWSHEHKVAGMSDVIIDQGDYFWVVDFKTNKEFGYESKYNDFFFEPLQHLNVCEFNAYCLQLSTYAYMYELKTGKRLKRLFVMYLRADKKSFDIINLNYMRSEVHSMLEHYKTINEKGHRG